MNNDPKYVTSFPSCLITSKLTLFDVVFFTIFAVPVIFDPYLQFLDNTKEFLIMTICRYKINSASIDSDHISCPCSFQVLFHEWKPS